MDNNCMFGNAGDGFSEFESAEQEQQWWDMQLQYMEEEE